MRLRSLLTVAAVALGACAHTEPFQPQDSTTDRPFAPGAPTRLTYNPGADLHPAWFPDGSAFIYAWQQFNQPDHDRCLGIIGASGGTRTTAICNPNPAAVDSADLFDSPSPSNDGRLLYLRGAGLSGAKEPDHLGIFLGTVGTPLSATPLVSLPTTIPGGPTIGSISTARWLDADHLVFVGQSANYVHQNIHCPLDTLVSGLALVQMSLVGGEANLAVIPTTDAASSASLNAGRDTLYYTLDGDSRVYRRAIATGQVAVAHDFGGLGIARDVTVFGGQMVAVVGGLVQYLVDGPLGPIQIDAGGNLMSVDLATDSEAELPISQPMLFRKPEFNPSGNRIRLVVEALPSDTLIVGCEWHQMLSRVGDLYLFESP